MRAYLYGPLTRLGLIVAVLAAVADQAAKLWLLFVFQLGLYAMVPVTPFFDLVMAWNTGISYGLFPQEGDLGQWALLGVKVVAVAALWIWLAHAPNRLTSVSLGLIIGGAIGNAIDRVAYGAVFDFALFHLNLPSGRRFDWYVFNLADVAIVAGVVGVLYVSLVKTDAVKAP